MMNSRYLSLSLLAAAVLAGCQTVPENQTLEQARSGYASAQSNPQVAQLAPLELKEAGDALARANAAAEKREDARTIENLAYVAKQKVAIAEETATRKNAEAKVNEAAGERSKVQLEARTVEAEQARQQAAAAQQTAEEKAAALAASEADAEIARQQAMAAQQSAEQNAAARSAAEAEAEAARQQAAAAQNQSAAALAAADEQNKARLEAMQAQLDALNAKPTPRGMVITLGDVLFDTGKAQLKSGGTRNVQKLADFLKNYPERKVEIDGFTDSVGSEESNQALSEQRANAVRASLENMGVAADRISTRGFGESLPVASNATRAGRQLNRRVEIVLSDDSGNIPQR